MGWDEILHLNFYGNFKTSNILDIFAKDCDNNFKTCEKTILVSHLYYTYAKLLELTEMASSTSFKWGFVHC
jgi:hypothetical protein